MKTSAEIVKVDNPKPPANSLQKNNKIAQPTPNSKSQQTPKLLKKPNHSEQSNSKEAPIPSSKTKYKTHFFASPKRKKKIRLER